MMVKENESGESGGGGGDSKDTTGTSDLQTYLRPPKKGECFESQRVYKKSSSNSVLTLYLGSRELISRNGTVEPLRGVIYVDPKFLAGHRLYGQLTLIFRYGREDEEVMGLKFCNEAIIALKQIWPKLDEDIGNNETLSPIQEALVERLGKGAYPFSIEAGNIAPPSVQLIPAKKYNGAPIGTSYDIRVYIADEMDEKIQRRSMVKLDIRLIHKISPYITQPPVPSIPRSIKFKMSPRKLKLVNKFDLSSAKHFAHKATTHWVKATETPTTNIENNTEIPTTTTSSTSNDTTIAACKQNGEHVTVDVTVTPAANNQPDEKTESKEQSQNTTNQVQGPHGSIVKSILWADGRVSLNASLNKSAYTHGEKISVSVDVQNECRKIIKKLKIFAVQHVDVCMFSNGKFKNVVANIDNDNPIAAGDVFKDTFILVPAKDQIKNWIAIEGNFFNLNSDIISSSTATRIASSAPRGPQTNEERNVFAIYVSYYVKVKLSLTGMGGEVSLKLPFVLGYVENDSSDAGAVNSRILESGGKHSYDGNDESEISLSNIDIHGKSQIDIIEEEGVVESRKSSIIGVGVEEANDIVEKVIAAEVHASECVKEDKDLT